MHYQCPLFGGCPFFFRESTFRTTHSGTRYTGGRTGGGGGGQGGRGCMTPPQVHDLHPGLINFSFQLFDSFLERCYVISPRLGEKVVNANSGVLPSQNPLTSGILVQRNHL